VVITESNFVNLLVNCVVFDRLRYTLHIFWKT
jgi:hypothetical protein